MRLLAVDFGFRRIGIAVGETESGIATPRSNLIATGTLRKDAESLVQLARAEEADALIVGLPVELDGVEGKMARICRQLAGHIQELGCVVKLVDESMTSVQAEAELREHDLKASERRKLRDGGAACAILERYMHEETSA